MPYHFDKKIAFAITMGNTMAWADFALYAYFAPILSHVFFPFTSSANAYILYFIVFALGFFFRPIGSAIAGIYADRHGRKNTLLATVALSSLLTALIGCLPSYDTIGFFSPLLLTILRILQTMSVSAEPTNSGSLLIEHAPHNRKGFITSCVMIGIFLGFLLGIFAFYLLTYYFTDEQMIAYGWRISFLLFACLGIFVVFVLLSTKESPLYLQHKASGTLNKHPFKTAVTHHRGSIFVAFGYAMMMAVANYFLLGFVPEFLTKRVHVPFKDTGSAISIGLAFTVILIPLMGLLSDKYGRRRIMATGAIGFMVLGYPIMSLLVTGHMTDIIIAMILYGILLAPVAAVLPAALGEMFPFNVRCTAGAVGYNLALVSVGGTTPIIVESLLKHTHYLYSPILYISVIATIHLVFILASKETKNVDVTQ